MGHRSTRETISFRDGGPGMKRAQARAARAMTGSAQSTPTTPLATGNHERAAATPKTYPPRARTPRTATNVSRGRRISVIAPGRVDGHDDAVAEADPVRPPRIVSEEGAVVGRIDPLQVRVARQYIAPGLRRAPKMGSPRDGFDFGGAHPGMEAIEARPIETGVEAGVDVGIQQKLALRSARSHLQTDCTQDHEKASQRLWRCPWRDPAPGQAEQGNHGKRPKHPHHTAPPRSIPQSQGDSET